MNNVTTTWDKYPENSIEFADIMKLGFVKEEHPDSVWYGEYGFNYFLVYRNIGDFTLDWDVIEHNVDIWYENKKKIITTGDIKIVELYIDILENIEASKQKVDDAIKDVCEGKTDEHLCEHGKNPDNCIRKADTCFDCIKQQDSECYANPINNLDTELIQDQNVKIREWFKERTGLESAMFSDHMKAIDEMITSSLKHNRKLLYNFLTWLNSFDDLDYTEKGINFSVDRYLKIKNQL